MSKISPATTDLPEKLASVRISKFMNESFIDNSGLADMKDFIRQNSSHSNFASPKVSPSGLATSMSFSSRNGSILKTCIRPSMLAAPSPCSANCSSPTSAPATTMMRIIDETEREFSAKHGLKAVVDSWMFSFFISLVILANAVQMGFEVDDRDRQIDWATFEIAFLSVYLFEVVLRYYAHGNASFADRWFCLDIAICCVALFDTARNFSLEGERDSGNTIIMLRILRGMKIIRLIRLFRFFPELYLLVSSLGSAMKTVIWMWVLLGLVIYSFSLLFVSEMGRQYPEDLTIQLWFGTVVRACFTLFTIVTLENWVAVARHMWDDSPLFVVVVIFFMTITTYMIMNILVGVVVQHVIDKALLSKEEELTQMEIELEAKTAKLLEIFQAADCDGDTALSKAEFLAMASNKKLSHIFDILELKVGDVEALFDHMDVNRDGTLQVHEFVSAIMQMRGGARAKRVFELHNDVTRLSSAFAQHAQKTEEALNRIKSFEHKTETTLHMQGESIRRVEHMLEALTRKLCGSAEIPASEGQEDSPKSPSKIPRSVGSVDISASNAESFSTHKCANSLPVEEVVNQQKAPEHVHEELRGTAEGLAADGPEQCRDGLP